MASYTKADILQLLLEKHRQLTAEGKDWCLASEVMLDLVTESPEGTYAAKLKGKNQNAYITEIANFSTKLFEKYSEERLTKEEAESKIRIRLGL